MSSRWLWHVFINGGSNYFASFIFFVHLETCLMTFKNIIDLFELMINLIHAENYG